MSLQMKLRSQGTTVRSAQASRKPIVVAAALKQDGVKPGPAVLAAMVAMTSTGLALAPMTMPPMARADEVEDDANLSPFEKRRRDLERRRELLRQAREKAEAGNDTTAAVAEKEAEVEQANEARRAETERARLSIKKLSVDTYEKEAAKSIKAPTPNVLEDSPLNFSLPPPPEKLSDIKVPDFKGLAEKVEVPKFQAPKFEAPKFEAPKFEAPAPAPAPRVAPVPVPVPVPVPAKAPAPAKEVKAAEAQQSKKRKGPLPLALAEILVLGSFVGLGFAATKYQDQSAKAINSATGLAVSLYQKAEAAISKK